MKKKTNEQLIFPLIVGVISLWNIVNNLHGFELTSVIVSLIGLAGVSLFMLNKKIANLLFYIWIIAQLVTYISPDFTYVTEQFQFLSLKINFYSKSSLFTLNFTPLFYFIGYGILKTYNLIGKQISIQPIKADSHLRPLNGEIIEVVNLSAKDKWFKVSLNKDNSMNLESVLIKPKNDERFSRKSAVFAMVKEGNSNNSFIDWGKVILTK